MADTPPLKVVEGRDGCADTVKFLGDLLEDAREGRIICVAMATVTEEGYIGTGWSRLPPGGNSSRLLGAVGHLSWRLNRMFDQET